MIFYLFAYLLQILFLEGKQQSDFSLYGKKELGIGVLLQALGCEHKEDVCLAHPCRQHDKSIVKCCCRQNSLLIKPRLEILDHFPSHETACCLYIVSLGRDVQCVQCGTSFLSRDYFLSCMNPVKLHS